MSAPDPAYLRTLAGECVDLVSAQFGPQLDWSPESLSTLDEVCAELLVDGPLTGERLDLWWKVIGVTGFPFGLASRVLEGEPYKSLASFVRVLPAIAEQANRDAPKP
jgi:hypothetical protein